MQIKFTNLAFLIFCALAISGAHNARAIEDPCAPNVLDIYKASQDRAVFARSFRVSNGGRLLTGPEGTVGLDGDQQYISFVSTDRRGAQARVAGRVVALTQDPMGNHLVRVLREDNHQYVDLTIQELLTARTSATSRRSFLRGGHPQFQSSGGVRNAAIIVSENGRSVQTPSGILSLDEQGTSNRYISIVLANRRRPARVTRLIQDERGVHVVVEMSENGRLHQGEITEDQLLSARTSQSSQATFAEVPAQAPAPTRSRRYPPVSTVDTIYGISADMLNLRSIHTQGQEHKFISDDEILSVHDVQERTSSDLVYGVTSDGHTVIQQQATRGCTAGSAEMLIADRGGAINVANLRYTNLGNSETVASRIRRAGFVPVVTEIRGASRRDALVQLQNLLNRHGPAEINIGGEIGGHSIVVDAIDLDANTAIIRDPWHGWRLTVRLSALESRMGPSTTAVQISN